MILVWSTAARTDRKEIFSYIAKDNLQAAITLDAHLVKISERLTDNPHLGKQGTLTGTREILTKGT